MEHLENFFEQELTDTEREEFILTDKIERTETLEYDEDVEPLVFQYQIRRRSQSTASLRGGTKKRISRMRQHFDRRAFAAATVRLLTIEVNQQTSDEFELVSFIMLAVFAKPF